jgi:cell division protein FtsB
MSDIDRKRMIPLHIADQAVAACDAEIAKLREENARLKAEVEMLSKPAIIGGYNLSQYIRMANSETLEFDNGDIFADMTLPERIKYIVESHASLKAEVERLTKENALATPRHLIASQDITSLREQVERLTKENETRRKDMELLFASYKQALEDIRRLHWDLRDVKEGKQSK